MARPFNITDGPEVGRIRNRRLYTKKRIGYYTTIVYDVSAAYGNDSRSVKTICRIIERFAADGRRRWAVNRRDRCPSGERPSATGLKTFTNEVGRLRVVLCIFSTISMRGTKEKKPLIHI